MNKQEALKKLDEIFNPAIKRCKQEAKINQNKKESTKKTKSKK